MLLIGIYVFIGHIVRIFLASSIDRNEFSIFLELEAEIRRKTSHSTLTHIQALHPHLHTHQPHEKWSIRLRKYSAIGIGDTKTFWPHQTTIFKTSQIMSMLLYFCTSFAVKWLCNDNETRSKAADSFTSDMHVLIQSVKWPQMTTYEQISKTTDVAWWKCQEKRVPLSGSP